MRKAMYLVWLGLVASLVVEISCQYRYIIGLPVSRKIPYLLAAI